MRRLLPLLLLGALLAGCGNATASGSQASAPADDATAGPDAAGPLYDELTTVDGRRLDGAGYRDADLARWFWAPW